MEKTMIMDVIQRNRRIFAADSSIRLNLWRVLMAKQHVKKRSS